MSSTDANIIIRTIPSNASILIQYLPRLYQLINDGYDTQDRTSYGPGDMFAERRLRSEDQLLSELGPDAVVAIAFDTTDPDREKLVAVACLKRWKGKVTDSMQQSPGVSDIKLPDPSHREVTLCVSTKDSAYRRQGLVSRCLDALTAQLQAPKPIHLWVTVVEGVGNVEYWQRRGFIRSGLPEDVPAGTFASNIPFKIGTLTKTVV